MKISLLHPFTPKAAGVVEKSVATYHSQPHLKAMEQLAKEFTYEVSIEYFTPKFSMYKYTFENVNYKFYPVSFQWNGNHKKWKKQSSKTCFKWYKESAPDVTIINMSAHASSFCYNLSKELYKQQKPYVPMLGGQHYSNTPANLEYYQKAHHILVHTHLQRQQMQTMDMFKGKDIRVFPLGVNTEKFSLKEKNKDYTSPKLLYVGRITPLKQVHLAIEAVKKIKSSGLTNVVLNIIGPVSSKEYLQELKELVKKYSLERNISFLGHKEHDELPDYFQSAHLLLLPSTHESFGMVMVEAMACGTPVVAMEGSGGPEEIIDHAKNGMLCTLKNYANTVSNYFQDISKAEGFSIAARKKIVENYSMDKTYEVLKSTVQDAIKQIG